MYHQGKMPLTRQQYQARNRDICMLRLTGMRTVDIARRFNMHQPGVHRTLCRELGRCGIDYPFLRTDRSNPDT